MLTVASASPPAHSETGSVWNRDRPGEHDRARRNFAAWRACVFAGTADGYAIASLADELDIACAPVLREQLLGLLRPQACRLVIDLSKVSFCDASGLAVLVGTGRRARLLGGVLRLAAPAPAVASALRLTGLLRQFEVFPTVAAATARPRSTTRSPDVGTQAHTRRGWR